MYRLLAFFAALEQILEEFPLLSGADAVSDLGSFESESVFRTALLF